MRLWNHLFGPLPFIISFSLRACAQIAFAVSPDWNITLARSYEELSVLARSTVDGLIVPHINVSSGTIDTFDTNLSADLVAVISLSDFYSGNTTHEDIAKNSVRLFPQTHENYFADTPKDNRDPLYWGLASYCAYRAYGDEFFLNTAIQLWDQTFPYFVNSTQAETGFNPTRNISITPGPQCTSIPASTAGAIFTSADNPNDTSSDATAAGTFMVLSAYLYEENRDPKYLEAAELTGSFINNTLYNGKVVVFAVDIATCAITDNSLHTLASGFFIEGLAILANNANDGTWSDLLSKVVASTVQSGQWTGSNGVITEDGTIGNSIYSAGKGIFVRGLREARIRSDPGSDMAKYIDSFVNVQLNAVLGIASANGADYSSNWAQAPTSITTTYGGNVAALDVFSVALNMTTPSPTTIASTVTPTPTTSLTTSDRHSSTPIGTIVGGAVGGILGAVAIISFVVFCVRRRHCRLSELEGRSREVGSTPNISVEPFLETTPFRAIPPVLGNTSKTAFLQRRMESPSSLATFTTPISVDPPSENTEHRLSLQEFTGLAGSDEIGHLDEGSTAVMRELVELLRGRSGPPPDYLASR